MKKLQHLLLLLFSMSFFGVNAQCPNALAGFSVLGELDNSKYFLSDGTAQWQTAQSNAESNGGNLVSINSQAENDFLLANINAIVFIGYNDAASEGNFAWASGDPVTYENFTDTNSPNNDFGKMNFWNGGWGVDNQFVARRYIVEIPCDGSGNGITLDCQPVYNITLTGDIATTVLDYESLLGPTTDCAASNEVAVFGINGSLANGAVVGEGSYDISVNVLDLCGNSVPCSFTLNVTVETTGGGCPGNISGFTTLGEFGTSKYYLSNTTARPTDAQAIATANNGYLAVISSQAENDFIQQGADGLTYIGLNDQNTEGNLEWVNGEPLTYNNVAPCGFCNENSADQDFVVIQPWDGGWSFSNFFNQRKYIIEVPCEGGGSDECSFNNTFTGQGFVGEINELDGGYEVVSNDALSGIDQRYFEYIVSKNDGTLLSTSTSEAFGGGFLDRTTDIKYVTENVSTFARLIRAVDPSGTTLWTTTVNFTAFPGDYVASGAPFGFSVGGVFDNEIILVGWYDATSPTLGYGRFPLIIKLDLSGNEIWQTTIEENMGGNVTNVSIVGEAENGGYYLTYRKGGPFIIKVNNDGTYDWSINADTGDPPSEKRFIFGESPNGQNFYLGGNSFNSFKGFVSATDVATGNPSFGISLGANFSTDPIDYKSSLLLAIPMADGGIVVFYSYSPSLGSSTTTYLHDRYDGNGNLIWSRATPANIQQTLYAQGSSLPITLGAADEKVIFAYHDMSGDYAVMSMTSEGFFEPDCGNTGGNQPDLTVSNLSNLQNMGDVGEVVFFNFDLNNIGNITATGGYTINTYISTDNTFSNDDVLAGEVPTGDTPVGTIADVPAAITVPDLPDGDYFLIVVADALSEISEANENNNTVFASFAIQTATGGNGCAYFKTYPIFGQGINQNATFTYERNVNDLILQTRKETAQGFAFETTDIDEEGNSLGTFSVTLPVANKSKFGDYGYTLATNTLTNYTVAAVQANGTNLWSNDISLISSDPDIDELVSVNVREVGDHLVIYGVYHYGLSATWRPFMIKLDLNGNEIWQSLLPTLTDYPSTYFLEEGAIGGGYYITYRQSSTKYLTKIDALGNEDWAIGTAGDLVSNKVIYGGQSPDGNFVFFGVGSVSNGRADITKVDAATGTEVWKSMLANEFSSPSQPYDIGRAIGNIIPTSDGGVVMDAGLFLFSPAFEYFVVYGKLDANGAGVWSYDFPTGYDDGLYQPMVETGNGGFVFAKYLSTTNEIDVFKTNSDGLFDPLCGGGGGCPTSLTDFSYLGEFNGSAYFLSDDVARPVDAQAIANSNGGHLAVINSQAENDFLSAQINQLVYIGLNDFDNEGTPEWVNGDPVSYTNFDICSFCEGNSADMDFVVMHGWNGGWSWSNFYNQRTFIVEVPCGTSNNLDPAITLLAFSEEVENVLEIEKIHPNPASNEIFTFINSSVEQEVDILIFDARGTLIKSENVLLLKGENTTRMAIDDLPGGFYSIHVPQVNGKIGMKRFVKVTE